MEHPLSSIYDSENFRKQGIDLVNMLADALENPAERTIPYQSPEEALEFWKNYDSRDANTLFTTVFQKSTKLHSGKYMGHQVVPPAPLAALAGFLTEFMNNGMAVYEMGMAFNPIERIVCEWINEKIGYNKNSNGIITSGGTLGNLTALLTARAKLTNVWEEGSTEKLAIMVSAEAHYCVERAARIMGLGSEGVIKVPCDGAFKMKTELLQSFHDEASAKGMKIFAIVGSAGSTSTGAYEDLESIHRFASENKIWFHVDAAHGGAVLFSEKYMHLINGIEKADSVVLDFHKMMLTPALATGVFYKNGRDSYNTFHQKAQYLWATEEEDWYNSGKRTFECTKLGMCLKVFALLRVYGEAIFTQNVERLHLLAETFYDMIEGDPNFEVALKPQSNIVNFRFINTKEDKNLFNSRLRQKLVERGNFYIVQTALDGQIYLRVSLMNPLTTKIELRALLVELSELAALTKHINHF